MKRVAIAASVSGLVGMCSYAIQPAPPVHLENVRQSIEGNRWILESDLVQITECESRVIDRWFIGPREKWQQDPVSVSVGLVEGTGGSANFGVSRRPARVEYEITRRVKGRYRVTQEAYGCANGFEGEALSVEVEFDWRDVKN